MGGKGGNKGGGSSKGKSDECWDAGDGQQARRAAQKASTRTTSTTLAHITDKDFLSLQLHPPLQRSLDEVFQYKQMTKVQAASIPICINGVDVVAKAKTGTGKTLSFLLPALHRVLSENSRGPIKVLCMSPTRELATQTAEEAKSLLEFLPQHKVMTVLGGTNMKQETASFSRQAPLVLVATPGRLDDHLNNSGLQPLLANLKVLVFDEADQLLDMGFRPAIEKILQKLPARESRQTLLFSATFPQQLKDVTKVALRPNHELVDCIGAEETASNSQVEQFYSLCSLDDLFATTLAVLKPLVSQPHKIIAFLPTARETGLFAALFRELALPKTEILEIHSRKSQAQRTKISEQYRTMERGIMFSSDVSARGMDYPDVTFVLQIGTPSDRAQYLHRLGRTARAGKEGAGLLLLCDFEKFFLSSVKDLPLQAREPLPAGALSDAQTRVWNALPSMHQKDPQIGPQSYQAWLGGRKSVMGKIKWSPEELVEWANYFATDVMGLEEVPPLEAKTVGMMGLKGVKGLVIGARQRDSGQGAGGGKRGGKGGGAGGGGGGGKSEKAAASTKGKSSKEEPRGKDNGNSKGSDERKGKGKEKTNRENERDVVQRAGHWDGGAKKGDSGSKGKDGSRNNVSSYSDYATDWRSGSKGKEHAAGGKSSRNTASSYSDYATDWRSGSKGQEHAAGADRASYPTSSKGNAGHARGYDDSSNGFASSSRRQGYAAGAERDAYSASGNDSHGSSRTWNGGSSNFGRGTANGSKPDASSGPWRPSYPAGGRSW